MHINATVFIQAINFGVTYFFLKRILFKPIVQRIKQKETAKEKLLSTIKEKEALLVSLQSKKVENLQNFRKASKAFYAIDTTYEQELDFNLDYRVNTKSQQSLVEKTKNLLVNKVPHAF